MKYLIIGGTGSLGKKLIDRLQSDNDVIVYSRDESKHWTLRNELKVRNITNVKFIVGDVRDYDKILQTLNEERPDNVIIAAALKQVDTCEISPGESIATNLTGTQNVIRAVNNCRFFPKKVLFVSTDKSCSPVNSYGMCKAISERVVTSQKYGSVAANGGTKFLCTRYGNVLESRGSIIPLFKYQLEHAEFLTVTNPLMTRFIMTLDESVSLIQTTLARGENGETWIPILPAMKIGDLVEIFSELRENKPIKIVGSRPGEKLHEELVNESEASRTTVKLNSLNELTHYVIDAALSEKSNLPFGYSSDQNVLSKDDLRQRLSTLGILDASLASFVGRTIEEISN